MELETSSVRHDLPSPATLDMAAMRWLADGSGPLLIEAADADTALPAWIERHHDALIDRLNRHGALVFRGFQCPDIDAFHAGIAALGHAPTSFSEESSPRTHVGRQIFTSTEHPADHEIYAHNEGSYFLRVPGRVFFLSERVADDGGATTLVDGATVFERMAPRLRETFLREGWTYVRRYGHGLGLSWQQAFATQERSDVERYCARNAIEWEWRGDRLITHQHRDAVIAHPFDGRPVWFNHVRLFHRASIDPDLRGLLEDEGDDAVPFDTYYGSGATIGEADIRHIIALYDELTIPLHWAQRDFLVVDNLRMAHGRRPYRGARRVLFAMSNMIDRRDLRLASDAAFADDGAAHDRSL